MDFHYYEPAKGHGLAYNPLNALVAPRPIGWISSRDAQGRVNLAPYSFYNAVSEFPPVVYFAITGTYGSTPTKHSRLNAESTGEFVVNMVSESLKEQMNVTTTMVEFGVDELKLAGLTPEPSTLVKPPRVKESPVALECRYWRTIELPVEKGHETKRGSVVFGQVVGVHIDDSIIKDGRIDTLAFKPVARLGYSEYTTTDNVWRMRRPDDPKYQ
jgi:flavin reductase (DIM6/NTAB) family NADH-FMN oxidoreductase RutF